MTGSRLTIAQSGAVANEAPLGECRPRDVDRIRAGPARTARAATHVLVDAIHAHPRFHPRPFDGPAVMTTPTVAAASLRPRP
jgi:hypothetical protein